MSCRVFTRTWWRDNPAWPDGLKPHPGRRTILQEHVTREEALAICDQYNNTHKPGRLSRKAEFEEN